MWEPIALSRAPGVQRNLKHTVPIRLSLRGPGFYRQAAVQAASKAVRVLALTEACKKHAQPIPQEVGETSASSIYRIPPCLAFFLTQGRLRSRACNSRASARFDFPWRARSISRRVSGSGRFSSLQLDTALQCASTSPERELRCIGNLPWADGVEHLARGSVWDGATIFRHACWMDLERLTSLGSLAKALIASWASPTARGGKQWSAMQVSEPI